MVHKIILNLNFEFEISKQQFFSALMSCWIPSIEIYRVRFCLFAGGVVIHVTGPYSLLSIPLAILAIAYHHLSLFQRDDI